ncbi:TetR/AcrR family transcriptional regulator [Nocardia sp. NBC_01377]|uniref:TetR/AcrR family transcriptional regulator n=1 Tax=Nocardia sp. NBC_01377 TaxID=2903595 RepID=UPI003252DEA5
MGRPRQFDESILLDAATELFWSRGFDTSVEDVSRATGVGNGSIYAAYGSKRGLFLAAFERYCDGRARFVHDVVSAAPGSARAAVRELFEAVIDDCAARPDRRGCLMLNSIAQLSNRIPEVVTIGARTTAAMERSVAARLEVLVGVDDSFDTQAVAVHSATVVLVAQGLIHSSRSGTPRQRLSDIADVASRVLPGDLSEADELPGPRGRRSSCP